MGVLGEKRGDGKVWKVERKRGEREEEEEERIKTNRKNEKRRGKK